MKCTYCNETVHAPGGARNHQACNEAAAQITAWVREEPVDAVDAIASAIVEKLKRGDRQALAWLSQAVANYETRNLHLHAPEIADVAVMAGVEPRDLATIDHSRCRESVA